MVKIIETNQETSELVIDKKVTVENFDEHPRTRSLVTLYQPFNIQTKGYDFLRNISGQRTSEKDSLFDDITQFYTLFIPNLQKSNDRLENVVIGNLNDFKEFPWFVDWSQGKVTDEMITYFATSEDYRKRIAAYNVLAYGNHYALIKSYKYNAKIVLQALEKRFKE